MSVSLSKTETSTLKDALKLAEANYIHCNKKEQIKIIKTILDKVNTEEIRQKEIRIEKEINEKPETR